jgi:glutathione S-transferase
MHPPVLYSFRRCPYAMRARLALWASGTVCELREVVLARKPAALLAASAKGTVPVLVLTDHQVVDQSLDIMLWALRRNDPLQWLPENGDALTQAMQLVAHCDGEFKFHLDRYKYPNRFGLPDGQTHRAQGTVFLALLNEQLIQTPYLGGFSAGLADMATAPFVRQFAHTDPAWFAQQPWPELQSWLTGFEGSTAYQAVMKPYVAWAPEHAPVLFPAAPSAII